MQHTAALFFLLSLAEAASSQIVINEIGIAPTGGAGNQFIELFNRNGCTVDVSCYTLVFSSTSGSGNPTGWTIKIPSGKSIAPGGYFLLGGTAGTAGVSSGTGYPSGGILNSYAGVADVNIGSAAITANAVYMKQGLAGGNFSNAKGQLSLLDATGNLITSVSYNSGNNAGSYPLSAYTTCSTSGNTQGTNNVADPGNSPSNVSATFSTATNQGIYLNSSGKYLPEISLTPRASNTGNGGTQICSGPVLNNVSNASVCFATTNQVASLSYSASNAPINDSVTWSGSASTYFNTINNAALGSNVFITVPANVPPGIYDGTLTLNNACGNSCAKPFTITINALPTVTAGSYAPVCKNSLAVSLNGTPTGGTFSGTNVVGNNFVPPNVAGNYTINYAYTDAATGCSNTASTTINVSASTSSYTTACTNNLSFSFFGQTFTTTGLHTVLLNNGICIDTARVYLVVRQTVNIDSVACDSVLFNGSSYYADTLLTQTIGSAVTACDSIVKNIRVRIKKPSAKDTTVCLSSNGSFALLGQTFSTSGNYLLHTTNVDGCDSVVRLHLTVASAQTQSHVGCDSVIVKRQSFYMSTSFTDTLRNQQGCDSIIQTHNILVHHPSHTYVSICLANGQSYNFNGQLLIASGNYTTTLQSAYCDSVVHLYLLVASKQSFTLRSCNNVAYNGVTYASSTIVRDTVKSMVTSCDSLYREANIVIAPVLQNSFTACVAPGNGYSFNGQWLTASGNYTASFTTTTGCDSAVHLYLVAAKLNQQSIAGCDSVVYKGKLYLTSAIITDTVKSTVTQCDSAINKTMITVNKKPVLNTSRDTIICRSGTATLNASSNAATISWNGFGNGSSITVSPQNTTQYLVSAVDTNGCKNTKAVTVSVQDFSVALRADVNPALSGTNVFIQSSGNYFYSVAGWQPVNLFSNQTSKNQRLAIDTSLNIAVVGQSSLGCKDTASLLLNALLLDDVYVPSAFTPNGDGRNDEVKVMGTAIAELSFTIFNRWGQIIFHTTDKSRGWNGTTNGTVQPAGTYVYVVRVKKMSGQVVEKKGTVTLIR